MKRENLWFLVPGITVLVLLATLAYFFLGTRLNRNDARARIDQDDLIVTGDPIHYQDYLGKWISGETNFEHLLSVRGGCLVEITAINNNRVSGTYTVVPRRNGQAIEKYDFHGKFKDGKAEIEYSGHRPGFRRGTIALEKEKITIASPDARNSGKRIFVRARLEAHTVSLRDSIRYLSFTRDQIINSLGLPYKVFPSGKDGTQEGYYYPKHGLMVVFGTGKNNNRVAWIDCKEDVDINGARAGQNFKTIRTRLGWAPLIQTWLDTPVHTVYELIYYIDNSKVYFISESQDGANSRVLIYRR